MKDEWTAGRKEGRKGGKTNGQKEGKERWNEKTKENKVKEVWKDGQMERKNIV